MHLYRHVSLFPRKVAISNSYIVHLCYLPTTLLYDMELLHSWQIKKRTVIIVLGLYGFPPFC